MLVTESKFVVSCWILLFSSVQICTHYWTFTTDSRGCAFPSYLFIFSWDWTAVMTHPKKPIMPADPADRWSYNIHVTESVSGA